MPWYFRHIDGAFFKTAAGERAANPALGLEMYTGPCAGIYLEPLCKKLMNKYESIDQVNSPVTVFKFIFLL
jgi:hypothetical protein